jgi:hypothetical protein
VGMNQKLDGGKPPMWRGLMAYFAAALNGVAKVSQMGHDKYGEWGGWRRVENAQQRYSDALLRHLHYYAMGEKLDIESGLSHLAHAAWNALAILELELAPDTIAAAPPAEPAPQHPKWPDPVAELSRRHEKTLRKAERLADPVGEAIAQAEQP